MIFLLVNKTKMCRPHSLSIAKHTFHNNTNKTSFSPIAKHCFFLLIFLKKPDGISTDVENPKCVPFFPSEIIHFFCCYKLLETLVLMCAFVQTCSQNSLRSWTAPNCQCPMLMTLFMWSVACLGLNCGLSKKKLKKNRASRLPAKCFSIWAQKLVLQ